MPLRELLKGKDYVFIEYRAYISADLFANDYMQDETEDIYDDVESEYKDIYVGTCVYEEGYLKSLDGNQDYSLNNIVESYEWTDDENLIIWVDDTWFVG